MEVHTAEYAYVMFDDRLLDVLSGINAVLHELQAEFFAGTLTKERITNAMLERFDQHQFEVQDVRDETSPPRMTPSKKLE